MLALLLPSPPLPLRSIRFFATPIHALSALVKLDASTLQSGLLPARCRLRANAQS